MSHIHFFLAQVDNHYGFYVNLLNIIYQLLKCANIFVSFQITYSLCIHLNLFVVQHLDIVHPYHIDYLRPDTANKVFSM